MNDIVIQDFRGLAAAPTPTSQGYGLELFGIGTDDLLYHASYEHYWNDWTLFLSSDLRLNSVVPLLNSQTYQLEVFGIGTDNQLHHTVHENKEWLPWDSTEFPVTPPLLNLFVNSVPAGIKLYGIGIDNQIHQTTYSLDSHEWLPWDTGNFPISDAPKLAELSILNSMGASAGANGIFVFGIGLEGGLHYIAQIEERGHWRWQGWDEGGPAKLSSPLSGVFAANITSTGSLPSVLNVFALGTDGQLHQTYFDGTRWAAWDSGGPPPSPQLESVFACRNPVNYNTALFGVGRDNQLHHTCFDFATGTWGPWGSGFPKSPPVVSAIAVSNMGMPALEVFAIGPANQTYYIQNRLYWGKWQPLLPGKISGSGDFGPVSQETLDKILKLVPQVIFHPYEHFFPSSIEFYLENGKLCKANGSVVYESPSFPNLKEFGGLGDKDAYYLSLRNDWSDSHRFGFQPKGGVVNAPVYFRMYDKDDGGIWLDFMFFYPYNGPQNFRFKYNHMDRKHILPHYHYRVLRIPIYAEHLGDFEHVELQVSKDFASIQQIVVFQHGDPMPLEPDEVGYYKGTHPIFYAARDSHATYAQPGHYMTYIGDLGNAAVMLATHGSIKNFNTDDQCAIIGNNVKRGAIWSPWENPSNVVQYGVTKDGNPIEAFGEEAWWVYWRHRWGASRTIGALDIRMPERDPGEDIDSDTIISLWAALMAANVYAEFADKLPQLTDGKGVSPPDWWTKGY